jgi:hypothetical protein
LVLQKASVRLGPEVVQQQAHGMQALALGHFVEALADLAGRVALGQLDLLRLAQVAAASLATPSG